MREEVNLTWEQVVDRAKSKLVEERKVLNPTDDQIYSEIILGSQRSRQEVNKGLGL